MSNPIRCVKAISPQGATIAFSGEALSIDEDSGFASVAVRDLTQAKGLRTPIIGLIPTSWAVIIERDEEQAEEEQAE